ncbi:hypothetical protein BaRGS_00026680 [Batillaria attramentaria]|uniref:Uncharacterized protein n=1 Tax=Batillaria attramentaria TaxID=370345 RepID=A0ABD0K598_9CAEN
MHEKCSQFVVILLELYTTGSATLTNSTKSLDKESAKPRKITTRPRDMDTSLYLHLRLPHQLEHVSAALEAKCKFCRRESVVHTCTNSYRYFQAEKQSNNTEILL